MKFSRNLWWTLDDRSLYRDRGGLARVADPERVPGPDASPSEVAPELRGGARCERKAGHAEWTAWTPNRRIEGTDPRGQAFELDISGQREKIGGPTFAAITSRSDHPGGILALFGDGSVIFLKPTIAGDDLAVPRDRLRRGDRLGRRLLTPGLRPWGHGCRAAGEASPTMRGPRGTSLATKLGS